MPYNFDGSASSCLTIYQKALWGGFFGCKNVLNFTCLTIKFHDCHHTNAYLGLFPQSHDSRHFLFGNLYLPPSISMLFNLAHTKVFFTSGILLVLVTRRLTLKITKKPKKKINKQACFALFFYVSSSQYWTVFQLYQHDHHC